jgi:hypothetical protein
VMASRARIGPMSMSMKSSWSTVGDPSRTAS